MIHSFSFFFSPLHFLLFLRKLPQFLSLYSILLFPSPFSSGGLLSLLHILHGFPSLLTLLFSSSLICGGLTEKECHQLFNTLNRSRTFCFSHCHSERFNKQRTSLVITPNSIHKSSINIKKKLYIPIMPINILTQMEEQIPKCACRGATWHISDNYTKNACITIAYIIPPPSQKRKSNFYIYFCLKKEFTFY